MKHYVEVESFSTDRKVIHGPYDTEFDARAFMWRINDLQGRFPWVLGQINAEVLSTRYVRPARPGLPAAEAQACEDDWQLALRGDG